VTFTNLGCRITLFRLPILGKNWQAIDRALQPAGLVENHHPLCEIHLFANQKVLPRVSSPIRIFLIKILLLELYP
jgi:hypothetical protein